MHDGAYATLEEVVDAYDRGGSSAEVVGDKSVQLQPLELTEGEKSDLVEFLRSLTGAPQPLARVTSPELPP